MQGVAGSNAVSCLLFVFSQPSGACSQQWTGPDWVQCRRKDEVCFSFNTNSSPAACLCCEVRRWVCSLSGDDEQRSKMRCLSVVGRGGNGLCGLPAESSAFPPVRLSLTFSYSLHTPAMLLLYCFYPVAVLPAGCGGAVIFFLLPAYGTVRPDAVLCGTGRKAACRPGLRAVILLLRSGKQNIC